MDKTDTAIKRTNKNPPKMNDSKPTKAMDAKVKGTDGAIKRAQGAGPSSKPLADAIVAKHAELGHMIKKMCGKK